MDVAPLILQPLPTITARTRGLNDTMRSCELHIVEFPHPRLLISEPLRSLERAQVRLAAASFNVSAARG